MPKRRRMIESARRSRVLLSTPYGSRGISSCLKEITATSKMENEAQDPNRNAALINSFCEITSSTKEEATFFLESHNWDLDAAVSTFLDDGAAMPAPPTAASVLPDTSPHSPSPSQSPSRSYSPSLSRSPSRSRSTSPARAARAPYELRSRGGAGKKKVDRVSGSRARGVRTLADLNRSNNDDSGTDSDEPQEYYTGGEKSGMLVQDPTRKHDVESIFDQARRSGAAERHADALLPSSSSRSFTGTARLLTGETVPSVEQPPEVVNHTITFWHNGFTIDDGPLRRLDDPENASFLESIKNSQCPDELVPSDRRTAVHVDLVRREEPYKEPKKRATPFRGTARTLGSIEAPAIPASAPTPAATSARRSPVRGLVVDESQPSTSIQLRLSDGTRMISRFNYHHTIGDIRSFIAASRPGEASNYQLQAMGFPPKQLLELEQTIEEAGIANSVVMQKF